MVPVQGRDCTAGPEPAPKEQHHAAAPQQGGCAADQQGRAAVPLPSRTATTASSGRLGLAPGGEPQQPTAFIRGGDIRIVLLHRLHEAGKLLQTPVERLPLFAVQGEPAKARPILGFV